MESAYDEPVALLHELVGDGCPDGESIFTLLAQLESEVHAGASSRLPKPMRQAVANSRSSQKRILTRYVE
jgi:hypothetical protein